MCVWSNRNKTNPRAVVYYVESASGNADALNVEAIDSIVRQLPASDVPAVLEQLNEQYKRKAAAAKSKSKKRTRSRKTTDVVSGCVCVNVAELR